MFKKMFEVKHIMIRHIMIMTCYIATIMVKLNELIII